MIGIVLVIVNCSIFKFFEFYWFFWKIYSKYKTIKKYLIFQSGRRRYAFFLINLTKMFYHPSSKSLCDIFNSKLETNLPNPPRFETFQTRSIMQRWKSVCCTPYRTPTVAQKREQFHGAENTKRRKGAERIKWEIRLKGDICDDRQKRDTRNLGVEI